MTAPFIFPEILKKNPAASARTAMGGHGPATLRCDPGHCLGQTFEGDGHMVGIGVQNHLSPRDPGDVPLPEQQVTTARWRAVGHRLAQATGLKIAVTGAGDPAGEAGGLHQT